MQRRFVDWIYNDSMFLKASGFTSKNVLVEKICCKNPAEKLKECTRSVIYLCVSCNKIGTSKFEKAITCPISLKKVE
jgi:hypothetical protein